MLAEPNKKSLSERDIRLRLNGFLKHELDRTAHSTEYYTVAPARLRQSVGQSKIQESIMALASKYAINPKTVAKWKKRKTVQDAPMGPKNSASTVLSKAEEAMIVAFRKHTLLPLDDCLYALQASIPKLTRSSLHRCLQRHGISRLPDNEGNKRGKKKFKSYPIGFFHIDIAEVRTEEGKLHLFVAIDRTSKFVMTKLTPRATMAEAQAFLEELSGCTLYHSYG